MSRQAGGIGETFDISKQGRSRPPQLLLCLVEKMTIKLFFGSRSNKSDEKKALGILILTAYEQQAIRLLAFLANKRHSSHCHLCSARSIHSHPRGVSR